MKNKILKRSLALFVALMLTASSIPTANVFADQTENAEAENSETETTESETTETEEEDRVTLEVSSADDFENIVKVCKLQTYGSELDVQLESDLDLSEITDFEGFSSFSGRFYGNGHTIAGVCIDSGDGAIGLFGYVEEGALIKDLTVDATIVSNDSANYLGIIAGVNAGEINNCTAKGSVTGTGITGGICALNGGVGQIIKCTNKANVSSVSSVGGIAGENRGNIKDCTNKGGINEDSDWLNYKDETTVSLTVQGILDYLNSQASEGYDIGGIAGWSNGSIEGSVNSGVVGYQHAGKNVGGIAGRMCGTILKCTNKGKVYGKQDVGGIVGQFEPTVIADGESLSDAVDQLNALSNQLSDDAAAAGNAVSDQLDDASDALDQYSTEIDTEEKTVTAEDVKNAVSSDNIKSRIDSANNSLNTLENQAKEQVSSEAAEIGTDESYQKVADALNSMSDRLSSVSSDVNYHTTKLSNDMSAINDKIADINSLCDDQVSNLDRIADGGDVIEDYSPIYPDREDASRVTSCINQGYVDGDRNVGGIAGALAIEGTDADDSKTEEEGNTYATLAVLEQCKDSGVIVIKKQNAGGIVGSSDLGMIRNNTSKGRVIGDDASYVGGIAGYAKGTITNCNALGVINGTDYVGGIAGVGKKVRNCYSIINIIGEPKWEGAILGDVVNDEEDDITVAHAKMMDSIFNNYFVSDSLYGIDGVNYAGISEEISYKELNAIEGISTDFTNLKVTFLDTDYSVLKTEDIKYGNSLQDVTYPEVELDDSEYVEWEGNYTDAVTGNVFLIASEADNVSVLAGDIAVNDKPVAMVQGHFYEDSSLELETLVKDDVPNYGDSDRIINTYRVKLVETSADDSTESKIRFLKSEEGEIEVYQYVDDSWEKCQITEAGSYVQTSFTGKEAVFSVQNYQAKPNYGLCIGIGAGAAVLIILLLVMLKKKKAGSKNKKTEA